MGQIARYEIDGCEEWSDNCLTCPIDSRLCPRVNSKLDIRRFKIRADVESGMDKEIVAIKYGVSVRTVYRANGKHKNGKKEGCKDET
jgi:DNA invertase Pin-like site-specific DNA recombinase